MIENTRTRWTPEGTLVNIGQPDWLVDEPLQTLMNAFEDAGFQIFAVGGCVRDTVLNRPVADVDLSTDAHPTQIIRIIESLTFEGGPWKAVPTGLDHGTITAVVAERTYEVTTFRKDIETDGRHAVVAFSDRIEDDATRRDFTINAFYADRQGRVQDIVGGSADLRDRRIRFIGDPIARIKEDYLRILRFFRFTASHGLSEDGINADGLAACAMLADGLTGVSRERIGAEMSRLIGETDVAPIIGAMEQSGVLHRILPGASVLTLSRLIHLEDSYPIKNPSSLLRDVPTRLAALGCEDVAELLRLSNADSKKVKLVRTEAGTATPPHELGYRHGYWPAVHCLLLRWAALLLPFNEAALDEVQSGANADFPIAAADLMPIYEGKSLGDRLKHLEATWIASRFTFTREDLLALP